MINSIEDSEHQDFLRHKTEFERFYNKVSKYVPFDNLNIVDIGASWGMHIGFIVNSGAEYVTGIDIADYNEYFKGDYKFKIVQYYEKHGYKLTSNKYDLVIVTKYIMQISHTVTFQLMVMILKIKASIRNLCIVCSVTTP